MLCVLRSTGVCVRVKNTDDKIKTRARTRACAEGQHGGGARPSSSSSPRAADSRRMPNGRSDDISTCGRRPCGTGTVGQGHTTHVTHTPFNNILIVNSYVTGGRGA